MYTVPDRFYWNVSMQGHSEILRYLSCNINVCSNTENKDSTIDGAKLGRLACEAELTKLLCSLTNL